MSGKHSKHLNRAIGEALKSNMKNMHGAVAVRGGKCVSVGHNKKLNRFMNENVTSVHAEMAAIQSIVSRNRGDRIDRLLCR